MVVSWIQASLQVFTNFLMSSTDISDTVAIYITPSGAYFYYKEVLQMDSFFFFFHAEPCILLQ